MTHLSRSELPKSQESCSFLSRLWRVLCLTWRTWAHAALVARGPAVRRKAGEGLWGIQVWDFTGGTIPGHYVAAPFRGHCRAAVNYALGEQVGFRFLLWSPGSTERSIRGNAHWLCGWHMKGWAVGWKAQSLFVLWNGACVKTLYQSFEVDVPVSSSHDEMPQESKVFLNLKITHVSSEHK